MSYKIISKFIKDISFEIPNAKTYAMLEKEIPKYNLNFEDIILIKIFLVTGTINKKPIKSVKNPGIISNKAAKANAAPDIIS